ncbi:T9SS type A sorting domain-containing protein [Owenweeksia hongkongensis]|uniref:T9SS type A sorting domain-containing protein n=1 Tax=Owenweeksia hongkongensis TaxID=253245 RepID=UPI003A9364A7
MRHLITGGLFLIMVLANTLNAQSWSAIGTGLGQDTCTRTIATTDGNDIYVADYLRFQGGAGHLKVRKWNGQTWTTFPSYTIGHAELADIAIYKGDIYIAIGYGSSMLLKFDGIQWSLMSLPPGDMQKIRSLEVYNGQLIIGGRFFLNDGTSNYDNIIMYDGTNFSAMPGLVGIVWTVTDVHIMNAEIYCLAERVYKWDGNTWNAWASTPLPQGGNLRRHLKSYHNELYYARYTDGTLYKMDSNAATLVTTLPFKIQDMDVYNNELYLVGDSTVMGPWPNYSIGGGLVKYDGQNFTTLSAPSAIRTGAVYNGELCYFSSSTLTYNGNQYDRAFKMSSVLGLGEIGENQTSLSVYPNPARGMFYIENSLNEKQEIKLIDATGKVIRYISLQPEMKAEVGTDGLAPGIYFINNGSNTHRVIITP